MHPFHLLDTRHARPAAAAGAAIAASLAMTVVLAMSGCVVDAPASKAGPGTVPQAFVIGVADSAGRPVSDDVEHLAALIEEYSGGALVPEIRWDAHEVHGAGPGEGYSVVGDMVIDAEVDLAVLPDFVWIAQGAKRLSAVKTPFLVTEQSTMDAIATSELADEMLGELDGLGLTGLALLPETLRHPIGFDAPFLDVADLRGATVRSLDRAAWDLIEAFGGSPTSVANEYLAEAVQDGRVQGAESAYAQLGTVPSGGTFTGDVTLFAKLNTAVANAAWFDGLGEELQAAVRRAADETVRYVVDTNPTEAQSAATFCAAAGSIALAGPEAVAAFEAAARPVRDRMARDPAVRETIAAIEAIEPAAAAAGSEVQPCDRATSGGPDAASGLDAETAAFPEGAFRADIQYEDFIAVGVDAGPAREHAGVWTLTFEDGVFADPGCPGSTYRVQDERVSVHLGPVGESCGTVAGAMLFSARWTYEDGALRFIDIIGSDADGPDWQEFHEVLWGSQPWQRIE